MTPWIFSEALTFKLELDLEKSIEFQEVQLKGQHYRHESRKG